MTRAKRAKPKAVKYMPGLPDPDTRRAEDMVFDWIEHDPRRSIRPLPPRSRKKKGKR